MPYFASTGMIKKKKTLHDIDIYYFFVFLHGKPGFLTHVSCMTSLVSEAKH